MFAKHSQFLGHNLWERRTIGFYEFLDDTEMGV